MGRSAKKMTKTQMKEFKKLLLKMREDIIDEIDHINKESRLNSKEASGNLSSYTLHMADIASDNFEKELNLELASNEREVLMAIDEALHRIEEGTYGICMDCKKPIAKSRLKVLPYALLCKKCQEKREKAS